ncbi:MAG TPA: hypothetical protein VJ925_09605 [Longimicrobiales bacterium]|nr:hypothetical protein [Longimicrobiales bacterium]
MPRPQLSVASRHATRRPGSRSLNLLQWRTSRGFIRDEVRTDNELFDLIEHELGSEASALLQDLMATI